ncbi:MAG: HAD family hydrolase, partial [Halanaerobiales bacterium]
RHKLDIHKRGSKLVEMLREAGYKLVLATNPLFPHIAVVERMKWAGINPGDFDFISSYEKLHFSKPNPDFFIELTNRTGVEPKNCVMIGNDVQEDLVASELGMKTFLIEDYIIDRSEGPHYTPDWRGSLEELISLVEEKVAV